TALHFVTDGLHEVGLAHSDATVEEERIVGLGGRFGDGQRGCVCELVSASDDKSVEGVARVQLRGAIEVESNLRSAIGLPVFGKTPVMADRGFSHWIRGWNELYVLEFEAEVV